MNETIIRSTAETMVDTMKKLSSGEITPDVAKAICLCGKTVIDAHNAELKLIHELKALQKGGMVDGDLVYLEPQVQLPPGPVKVIDTHSVAKKKVKESDMDGWKK